MTRTVLLNDCTVVKLPTRMASATTESAGINTGEEAEVSTLARGLYALDATGCDLKDVQAIPRSRSKVTFREAPETVPDPPVSAVSVDAPTRIQQCR